MSAWQPISNAPRDCSDILVLVVASESGEADAYVVHYAGEWNGIPQWSDQDVTFAADLWMPLPEPPSGARWGHSCKRK